MLVFVQFKDSCLFFLFPMCVFVCVRGGGGLKKGDKSFGLGVLFSLIPQGVAANSMLFPGIPVCLWLYAMLTALVRTAVSVYCILMKRRHAGVRGVQLSVGFVYVWGFDRLILSNSEEKLLDNRLDGAKEWTANFCEGCFFWCITRCVLHQSGHLNQFASPLSEKKADISVIAKGRIAPHLW